MAERKRTKGRTIQWPKEKEQKDKQYNGRKKKNKYNGRQKKNKMTYNTMAERKRTKGQTIIYKTLHSKLKI
jgi:hypothetical protein